MSDPEAKNCSRPGCGKKLRSNNHTGECGSGCLSPAAPPTKRAKGVSGASSQAKAATAPKRRKRLADAHEEALESFRAVCIGLGRDPDEEIAKFCTGWLDALRERLA
ncbi:MAG: hypothetical protein AMXMBFR56_72870 [Polyangiaceae bacterium]